MTRRHAHLNRRHGVSLIEALIALAVMAFGMLSLVGVQATLRLNSDLSKQRSEAIRVASEELESLRFFPSIAAATPANGSSWDERIITVPDRIYAPPTDPNSPSNNPVAIGNASYTIVRTVSQAFSNDPVQPTAPPAGQQKLVTVQVRWTDRTGTMQAVTLDSIIAGAAPVLSALLLVPARPSPTNQIHGRNATIPEAAVDQPDGITSLFSPPGSSGVSWYFNNTTGLICIGSATCAVPARLVSGNVNFDLGPLPPSSEHPLGPALNLASGPGAMAVPLLAPQNIAISTTPSQPQCYANAADSRPYVNYFCAVTPASNAGWGGQLNLNSTLTKADGTVLTLGTTGANRYQVCRYTTATPSIDDPSTNANEALTDPNGDYTANVDHPKTYCLTAPNTAASCLNTHVTGNLINQSFLVIDGAATCPGDNPATPLVNGNTRPHQP
jgi:Tfp pilus assembly protein PilV